MKKKNKLLSMRINSEDKKEVMKGGKTNGYSKR